MSLRLKDRLRKLRFKFIKKSQIGGGGKHYSVIIVQELWYFMITVYVLILRP